MKNKTLIDNKMLNLQLLPSSMEETDNNEDFASTVQLAIISMLASHQDNLGAFL